MRHLIFLAISVLSFGIAFSAAPAVAQSQSAPLRLTLEDGISEPLPIVVLDFFGPSGLPDTLGAQIASVIKSDLTASGVFRVAPNEALKGKVFSVDAPPDFGGIRALSNARALVTGAVSQTPDGRLDVRFRLWDVVRRGQIDGFRFLGDQQDWRRMAHRTADSIYKALTGEPGYFETRIVFVDESGPKNNRVKRLAVMDFDGANLQYLTGGASLVLTPRFSPTSPEITYISYRDGLPRVYLLDTESRRQEILGRFPGMTFAPQFSPDGSSVLMSLSRAGNSDIYEMELRTRRIRRLTNNSGIDTAASYAPDGSSIVFESDRGGTQQLYVMSSRGGDAKRISFGKGRYATPVWSPRGDLIAFTKIEGGKFGIGVMRPDGTGERILTSSFLDEGPTWAPNGRRLMFFREERGGNGRPQLYTIDIRGGGERRVQTPNGGSDPAWGPLMRNPQG